MRDETTPLLEALRSCTVPEQHDFAKLAMTKRNYLYQLACGEREPKIRLAQQIVNASIEMHVRTRGRVPKLKITDLLAA